MLGGPLRVLEITRFFARTLLDRHLLKHPSFVVEHVKVEQQHRPTLRRWFATVRMLAQRHGAIGNKFNSNRINNCEARAWTNPGRGMGEFGHIFVRHIDVSAYRSGIRFDQSQGCNSRFRTGRLRCGPARIKAEGTTHHSRSRQRLERGLAVNQEVHGTRHC